MRSATQALLSKLVSALANNFAAASLENLSLETYLIKLFAEKLFQSTPRKFSLGTLSRM